MNTPNNYLSLNPLLAAPTPLFDRGISNPPVLLLFFFKTKEPELRKMFLVS